MYKLERQHICTLAVFTQNYFKRFVSYCYVEMFALTSKFMMNIMNSLHQELLTLTKNTENGSYCRLIVRLGKIPWLKIGANLYHAQLILLNNGQGIKELLLNGCYCTLCPVR